MEYLMTLAVAVPVFGGALFAYRLGMRDGQRLMRGQSVIPDKNEAPAEVSDKIKRMQTLVDNIDAYDGTDKGQVTL